jgi:hypothetical protein
MPGMVAHTCKPNIQDAEAGGSWVQDQSWEPVSKKKKKKKFKLTKTMMKFCQVLKNNNNNSKTSQWGALPLGKLVAGKLWSTKLC